MKLLIRLTINILTLMIVATILPGFVIVDWWAALTAAVIIGLINTFLRPLILILTLPLTLITFGLFALIINVLLLQMAAVIVPGFTIDSWLTAFLASVLISLVSSFLGILAKK